MSYEDDYSTIALVGKTVQKIYMNEDRLVFVTDQGVIEYGVYGDCCSHSYFYDFYGVKKLLENGKIVSTRELSMDDPTDEDAAQGEVVAAYGFEFVTVHPKWGEQTSVMSFRNDSNGYYGGSLNRRYEPGPVLDLPELTDDLVSTDVTR